MVVLIYSSSSNVFPNNALVRKISPKQAVDAVLIYTFLKCHQDSIAKLLTMNFEWSMHH